MRHSESVESKQLRILTLKPILEGKSLEQIAKELNISVKGVKYRLTILYKYYGVKNRHQLMAQYIKFPSELYKNYKNFSIDKVPGKKEPSLLQRWKESQR